MSTARALCRKPVVPQWHCLGRSGSSLIQGRHAHSASAGVFPRKVALNTVPKTPRGHFPHFWKTDNPSDWEISPRQHPATVAITHSELKLDTVLNKLWLRDACTCSACVDPSSGQKRFATCDMPDHLETKNVVRCEDGSLEVQWKNDFLTNDTHVSRYPASMIAQYFGGPFQYPMPQARFHLWERDDLEKLDPYIDYDSFIDEQTGYASAMSLLTTHGLFFLRGVPDTEQAVETIAAKIGILQHTFYGRTWDVVSKPNAENVAYTSSHLGLHQDLLYMAEPPKIQILHCLKNSCEGGESLFSDGMRAGMQMREGFPNYYQALTGRSIIYHYNKDGNSHRAARKVLDESNFYRVFWSPPFQRPEQATTKNVKDSQAYARWVKAARTFRSLLEDDQYVYQYKMKPGECAVFDNHRIMHGRRQFDSSGERWLKGAYVDTSSFISNLISVQEQFLDMCKPSKAFHQQGRDLNYKYSVGRQGTESKPDSAEKETYRPKP
ncbi:Clavaminate synthase-like protein [Xylariaceae sp. FL0016]|nr:Clavaminate synthase-like protein [Xylariaceae sp. FL0016]